MFHDSDIILKGFHFHAPFIYDLCISLSSPLIPLPQDDVWLDVSRQRSSLPASAHASPDCRGHLHQFTGGSWLRQLLVLVDGCLYIYSDIEPDAPAIGESLPTIE